MMPNNLVLVRHGQSEGNVAVEAAKSGDMTFYERDDGRFMTIPGHQWVLTTLGRHQAAVIGKWVNDRFPADRPQSRRRHTSNPIMSWIYAHSSIGRAQSRFDAATNTFGRLDRFYVSPYVRTRQTASAMNVPNAKWTINRFLRERDWGDIGSITWAEFKARHQDNFHMHEIDPLYWVPSGGESIANVAENRCRNFLSTMHRECDGENVLVTTHGEAMWAFRMVLEYWKDEEFLAYDADPDEKITNCTALHYTRINPETGEQSARVEWMRIVKPVQDASGAWVVEESPWRRIRKETLTNEQILASVENVRPQFDL